MAPGLKGNYFKLAEAIAKYNREDWWKNNLYDQVFTSDIDKKRIKHLIAEVKSLCKELHAGGRVEITFDTRYAYGEMEYEGRHYKGKVATFTGRVSWVSFDSRLTLYAASLEAPRCWYNGWRKNPSIETKKEILENLLQEIECSHMDSYGKAYKTRFMKKYCDRALCQPAPEDSPQFYGWDNDSDDGNDTPIVRNGIIYRSQRRRRRSEGAAAGGRARSWAPGSGFDNGSGQAYTYV